MARKKSVRKSGSGSNAAKRPVRKGGSLKDLDAKKAKHVRGGDFSLNYGKIKFEY